MRRATIIAVRTMIVLLLGATALDLQIPGRSRERVRIHMVDRSDSVGIKGPTASLDLKDADEIIAHDRESKPSGDTLLSASFGRNVVFESPNVDRSATDLAGALTAALGRNPTEIVLYSDGRGDPGNALFLLKERGVPVHVLPIGPTSVQDARIVAIQAPADGPADTPVPISVTVQSTAALKTRVKVGAETREADLAPGIPARLAFTLPKPGKFKVDLDVSDDCDQNNHAEGEVFVRSDLRRILLLSSGFPALPGYAVTRATSLDAPETFDVVILDDVALSREQQERVAVYAGNGGGVLILGDPVIHRNGLWKGKPIERISPFQARPDLRVAVVLGLDASGSMNLEGKWELAVEAVRAAQQSFDADDNVVAMTFANEARILRDFDELRKIHPTGGTHIAHGIDEARKFLAAAPAGRHHIVLITDGEVSDDEKPELRRAAAEKLQRIGLTIITTNRIVDVGENLRISDWKALQGRLSKLVAGLQELERENCGLIEYLEHPVTKGVPRVDLARINRTTEKSDAQVVATVGKDPVLAFRQADQGRVGAFAIPYDNRLELLFRQAIEYVAGDGDNGLSLSIDPPFVRARGSFKEPSFLTTMTRVEMKQVASTLWEGKLPDGLTGTAIVRKGRARAAVTIPCPPEFRELGIDRPALERIARETGGRVLRSTSELAALPRPATPAPRSGRTHFLVAALLLVFVEMGISTFWKL
jgi:hypothetical protein